MPTTELPPALAKLRRTYENSQVHGSNRLAAGQSVTPITHAPQAGDLHALVPALEGKSWLMERSGVTGRELVAYHQTVHPRNLGRTYLS